MSTHAMVWLAAASIGAPAVDDGAAERVERHIAHLASDAMEGRAPGTPGGERAARYIEAQLDALGLETFLQPVPLVGHEALLESHGLFVVDGDVQRRVPREAYALATESLVESLDLEEPLVFVGHGIRDGASGWDDYRDTDVRGRVVAILPGLPENAARRFPGGEHGYVARDVEKLRTAAALGARGVVFLRPEIEPAREVERLTPDGWGRKPLEVVLDVDRAGLTETASLEAPSELDVMLRIQLRQRARRFRASNVVAVLRGADPDAGAVLVTAHYDAYGVGPPDERGDSIYNGALDNAAGTGALVELARHFASRKPPLPRTLVFVATTAEERGLLGMAFFAEHPAVPLAETVVALNIDGLNLYGATEDFFVFPSEGTDAGESLRSIGRGVDMRLAGADWQRGMHFAFDPAALFPYGVVGLTLWQGSSYRGLTPEDVRERLNRYGRIHTPADEWPGAGDRAAVAQHLALYVAAIEHWATNGSRPGFRPPGLLARP